MLHLDPPCAPLLVRGRSHPAHPCRTRTLPHQFSSARAQPRHELRSSAAFLACHSRVCSTPPVHLCLRPRPNACRQLGLRALLRASTPAPARAHAPRCLRHRRARLLPLACPTQVPAAAATWIRSVPSCRPLPHCAARRQLAGHARACSWTEPRPPPVRQRAFTHPRALRPPAPRTCTPANQRPRASSRAHLHAACLGLSRNRLLAPCTAARVRCCARLAAASSRIQAALPGAARTVPAPVSALRRAAPVRSASVRAWSRTAPPPRARPAPSARRLGCS
jgi:hypothetical protein